MSKLKSAFDDIQAEDNLKTSTLLFLQERIRNKPQNRLLILRAAAVLAALIIMTTGAFSLYFTESAYVDLDVNPSLALVVNRFDRVIGAYAYNAEGEDILNGIKISHMNYKDAVDIAMDEMEKKGYISETGLVSVTLQTNSVDKEPEMLSNLESAVRDHHGTAQVSAFSVDGDTRTAAQDLNLSPARYLAILELQTVDPAATVEGCRNHSLGELYRLTDEYSGGHHGSESQGSDSVSGMQHGAERGHGCGHG